MTRSLNVHSSRITRSCIPYCIWFTSITLFLLPWCVRSFSPPYHSFISLKDGINLQSDKYHCCARSQCTTRLFETNSSFETYEVIKPITKNKKTNSQGQQPPLKKSRGKSVNLNTTKKDQKSIRKKRRTSSFDARWNEKFKELVQYREQHGDCCVSQTYEPNPSLGRWVRYQRFDSYMTKERVDKLNSIGFIWDAKEAIWNTHVEELKAFRDKFGHVNVPQNCDVDNRKLSMWVQNQRVQYRYLKNGNPKKSFLTPERIATLESLGFVWDMNEVNWMEKWQMLNDFRQQYGHANVPSRYKPNQTLARWVLNQRVQYKKQKTAENSSQLEHKNKKLGTRLTQKRIDLLNSLDFVWDPSDSYWWEQYRALCEYKKKNGHCSIPSTFSDQKLVHWVHNQRRLCREYVIAVSGIHIEHGKNINLHNVPVSGLDFKRVDALRKIDFCWLPPLPGESTSIQQNNLSEKNLFGTQNMKKSKITPSPRLNIRVMPDGTKKQIMPFPWDEI